MGAKQQAVGAQLEQWVVRQCGELRARGLADVQRTKPPVNIIGAQRGKLLCVYSGEPSADFEGVLRGGRAVVFDAKSTKGDRFAFGLIPDRQLEYMSRRALYGARVFFLVRRRQGRAGDEHYVCPVSGLGRIAGVAHKRSQELLALSVRESVRFDDLEARGWRALASETWFDVVARQLTAGRWDQMVGELEEAE